MTAATEPKCPKCGSDFDFRASRAMPGWEGGWPYNQFKCYSVLDDNGFHQSDRCLIGQLEQKLAVAVAENKRLKDEVASLSEDYQHVCQLASRRLDGMCALQRHRDAWRGFARGKCPEPTAYLSNESFDHADAAEALKQIERLRDDAARWNYIRRECSQIGSAKMDSQHYWRFRQPYGLQGPTIDEAMDNAMRERPILSDAAKENQ